MEPYPFFSIIVPIFNGEKYLEECISSVIRQTFKSWELILVDDGSLDGSGEICDRFSNDPRIKVIHQVNAGELQARCSGYRIATGQYEIGLDSDDYLADDCLLRVKKTIDETGCDIVMFGHFLFGDKKGNVAPELNFGRIYTREELLEYVIDHSDHGMWNKSIRTDIVKNVDYSGLDPNVRFNLDCAQIVPIICKADSGCAMKDPLYYYRVHESSISQMTKPSHVMDVARVTEFVIDVLKGQETLDKKMQTAIYKAYLRTISFRILKLFLGKNQISKEQIERIKGDRTYRESQPYECCRFFHLSQYIVLKLFRTESYMLLRLFAVLFSRFLV